VRSKADSSSLIFGTEPLKGGKKELKSKKRICSEVSVNSLGNHGVSPEEEKEGYGGKDLQKRKVSRL